MSKISFGTSGWRGILADDFTPRRVAAVADAVGSLLSERTAAARVLVAHDTRLYGARFCALAARVLRARGAEPVLVRGAVPTPAIAHALGRGRADLALVFTASHNPPEYHGVKVFERGGVPAGADLTQRIESLAREAVRRGPVAERTRVGDSIDILGPYRDAVAERLDRAALRRAAPRVFYDAMHGAGSGVLDGVLRDVGVPVTALRAAPDPRFGGEAPDPAAARLDALRRLVSRGSGTRIGLATDGDADRLVAVDASGRVLSSAESAALLVDHLARTGRIANGVALSVAVGSLVERVARSHGLAVHRGPIGFKHLAGGLGTGAVDAAADESDGFAWGRFGRDKDGILAGCLLAELVAQTGESLGARLRRLAARHGHSAWGRTAVPFDSKARAALAALRSQPPVEIAGSRAGPVDARDGLRIPLDAGFLMLRASGTERLIRIYAEAPDARTLTSRLREGARLLGAASRLRPRAVAGRRMDDAGRGG